MSHAQFLKSSYAAGISFLSLMLFASQGLALDSGWIPVSIRDGNERPLGSGYNSRRQELLRVCVDNDNGTGAPTIDMENPRGDLTLSMKVDQAAMADKLGLSMKGKYTSGVTTTSAEASMLSQSASNSFSIAYNYVHELHYSESMNATRSRPIRPLPGFEKDVSKPDLFFDRCGDQYIAQRERAARLLININISFVSKAEKQEFGASFGLQSPASNFEAHFESKKSSFSSSNVMTVRILQIGGDPSRVGQAICPHEVEGGEDANCNRSAGAVLDCSFGKPEKCLQLIKNAIIYASQQGNNNFPTQVRGGQNYAVVAMMPSPYVYLGRPFMPPPTPQEVLAKEATMKEMESLFARQYESFVNAKKYYEGNAPRLSDRQKAEMLVLKDFHFGNLTTISSGIRTCVNEGQIACEKELHFAKAAIGIDRDKAAEQKQIAAIDALTNAETFIQFCDLSVMKNPSILLTIDTLRIYAKEHSPEEEKKKFDEGDRCRKLADYFEGIDELDLSPYEKLGDLRPIGTLKQLRSLNLANKGIRDISALGTLENLTSLTLDKNLIEDLSPILRMTNLRSLSIQDNKVNQGNLDKLKDLPYLTQIDGRGNAKNLTCPLKNKNFCKLLDFSDALTSFLGSNSCSMRVGHASVAIGDKVLVTGGYSTDQRRHHLADMMIASRNGCGPIASLLKVPRAGHTMTKRPDGSILIIGGHSDTFEIVTAGGTETVIAPARMSNVRSSHTATMLANGDVMVIGGYTDEVNDFARSNHIATSVDLITMSGQVIPMGRLQMPRAEHTASLLPDGRILVIGGFAKGEAMSTMEVVDPVRRTVTLIDPMLNVGRFGHSAITLKNGEILIVGGYEWGYEVKERDSVKCVPARAKSSTAKPCFIAVPEIETIHPVTLESNLSTERLADARGAMSAFLMRDNRVLLIGGESKGAFFDSYSVELGSASRTIQVFDPESQGIYSTRSLARRRAWFTATQIDSQSILIVGGAGDPASSQSTELLMYLKK